MKGECPGPVAREDEASAAGLAGQQAFALGALACKLAGAADGLGLFARLFFRRLLVVTAKLHFAEDALALHLLLERLQRLIDVVVANQNLHAFYPILVALGVLARMRMNHRFVIRQKRMSGIRLKAAFNRLTFRSGAGVRRQRADRRFHVAR